MSEKIKTLEILNFSKFFDFCLVLYGIFLTSFYSYLLFHTLIELFCIIIAGCIFVIAWNGRRIIQNNYLLFIGIAFLFVGGIDLMHALSYTGMGIIESYGSDRPTQLWIAARYMESISLFCAPFFLGRKLNPYYELALYLLITGLIMASVFYWQNFPVCFIEGVGLTPFKKISEYLTSAILLASAAGLFNKRKYFDDDVFYLLIFVIAFTIFSELSFTFYIDVYGVSNLVGHLFKIISFYLLYRAIVVTSFLKPYALLFTDLKNREHENKRLLEEQVNWRNRLEELVSSQNAVLENLNEGLIISDIRGNILNINSKALELLEFDDIKEALAHRDHYLEIFEVYGLDGHLIPVEDRPLSRVLRGERFTNYELLVCRTSTGKTWICSFSGTPVHNEKGEFILAVMILRDITIEKQSNMSLIKSHISERKILENALAKEKENFYFVLENLPAFVCLVRKDFTIAYANQYFKDRFGNPEGKLCHQILYHRQAPCDGCRMPLVFKYQKEHEWEMLHGEDHRVYHVYNYPYADTGGNRMLLKMGVDISKRVEAEKKLSQYSKQLELSNKELQNFAYVASHDLQEPLRKIQMFGNLLRTKYIDMIDDTGKDYFMRIESAALRMQNLIQALLQYSRITTQSQNFTAVDLNVVIHEVINDLDDLILRTNGRVEINNLATIDAEPNQMHQLFQNLITNALKFNDKPEPYARISGEIIDVPEVHNKKPSVSTCHRITVEDNGIGFEEKYADQIFIPFQRLHGRHKYEGTGIGLSICRKIVDRHHGSIAVKSVLGVGSSFIVTLPVKQTTAEQ